MAEPSFVESRVLQLLLRSPSYDVVPVLHDGGKVESGRFDGAQQVAYALRLAESGTPVADVCRRTGIAVATFYLWKKKFGSLRLGVPEVPAARAAGLFS